MALPSKENKINKTISNGEKQEMENWVIYITKENFCDEGVNNVLMATLSNTVCLFLSLAF